MAEYRVTGIWNSDTQKWDLATVGAHASVANQADAELAIRNAMRTALHWTVEAYNTTVFHIDYLPITDV